MHVQVDKIFKRHEGSGLIPINVFCLLSHKGAKRKEEMHGMVLLPFFARFAAWRETLCFCL
jgi:hypothetical protein